MVSVAQAWDSSTRRVGRSRLLMPTTSFEEYVLSFQSCQLLYETNESIRQFVIFRLCPQAINNHTESNWWSVFLFGEYAVPLGDDHSVAYQQQVQDESCRDEYAVPLEEYLSIVVPHQKKVQDKICRDCERFCNSTWHREWNSHRCISCDNICLYIEESGYNYYIGADYIDATVFTHCVMIYDGPTRPRVQLYAGPICAGEDGSEIKIGVFLDEYCTIPDPKNRGVDELLHDCYATDLYGYSVSYPILRSVYESDGIPCRDPNTLENNTVCESLYEESSHYLVTNKEQQNKQKVIETLQTDNTGTIAKWFVSACVTVCGIILLSYEHHKAEE